MTRAEHLQWCKDRSFELFDTTGRTAGLASFLSDMSKHDETTNHPALVLMGQLVLTGQLDTDEQMRHWIEGFN